MLAERRRPDGAERGAPDVLEVVEVPRTDVGLVSRLRDLGATVTLDAQGRVRISPAAIVTPALAAAIHARLPQLRRLLAPGSPWSEEAEESRAPGSGGCIVSRPTAGRPHPSRWGCARRTPSTARSMPTPDPPQM